MATYANVTDTTQPTFAPPGVGSLAVLENRIALATTDLTLANVIPIGRVPKGALVHDVILISTDLDSATSVLLSVGDEGSAIRFISSNTVAQAGGLARAGHSAATGAAMAVQVPYTTETLISLTVTAAPGTAVAGTVRCVVFYSIPAA